MMIMDTPTFISLIQPVLLIMYLAFFILFLYFGITLSHHLDFYTFNLQIKKVMKSVYFSVSTLILFFLLFFISLYIFGYGI
jgi:hypothetical protein